MYDFSSDDERLRCPGCVMKGFRTTVSKSFVHRRNMERENREWLKEIVEKDQKDEEGKLAADTKTKDITIRKAAQAAYKRSSVTKGLKEREI
jgi:plasmid stability protein